MLHWPPPSKLGSSPKPATAGFSLQKPTGLFAKSLKRVRKYQLRIKTTFL